MAASAGPQQRTAATVRTLRRGSCHAKAAAMTPPPVTPPPVTPRRPEMRGGGCLVAAGLLVGTVVGVLVREGSIGLIAGFAVGVVGAVLLYVVDRGR